MRVRLPRVPVPTLMAATALLAGAMAPSAAQAQLQVENQIRVSGGSSSSSSREEIDTGLLALPTDSAPPKITRVPDLVRASAAEGRLKFRWIADAIKVNSSRGTSADGVAEMKTRLPKLTQYLEVLESTERQAERWADANPKTPSEKFVTAAVRSSLSEALKYIKDAYDYAQWTGTLKVLGIESEVMQKSRWMSRSEAGRRKISNIIQLYYQHLEEINKAFRNPSYAYTDYQLYFRPGDIRFRPTGFPKAVSRAVTVPRARRVRSEIAQILAVLSGA